MKVAFVGVKRLLSDMPDGYWPTFVRFHLELPWYYAKHGPCDVVLTTVEPTQYSEQFDSGGSIRTMTESEYIDSNDRFDVIVHWRKWYDELADSLAQNVLLSQDHSYSNEWLTKVKNAYNDGILSGILVFPEWHKNRIFSELAGSFPFEKLFSGMTLGVDTEIYKPEQNDPFNLLWASDPGRGLAELIEPFHRLWTTDRRYVLTVTYPDYVKPESLLRFSSFLKHPGVRHMPSVRNGQALWSLFNSAGFLPYSSTFPEPSSRCHRQAMAAGAVVLYPPSMGTPSDLIENDVNGIVTNPSNFHDVIKLLSSNQEKCKLIVNNARNLAESENWQVQARRFCEFFR